ncbi:CocE/NonD family hydrolase (plasmid) [Salipiger sp. H15]|uniref:CocE/NonD family hydrolase n=1 Tax=Alloyangia sp. H15 TaxID=3029062 RepID=A0AAU8ATL4_9RHOB
MIRLAWFGAALAATAALAGALRSDELLSIGHDAMRKALLLRAGLDLHSGIMVKMPDGVRLATDVYLPRNAGGKLPALLIRLPYGRSGFGGATWWVEAYGPRGYALVIQDMRGRHGSEGVFAPYRNGAEDGAATLDWIAAQDWSNGRVATAGCSALGEIQLIQSKTRNPHLAAMIAEGAGGAIGSGGASHAYFGVFEGGIPNLAAAYGWFSEAGGKTPEHMAPAGVDPARVIAELPSGTLVSRHRRDPTDYEDFLANFENPDYWRDLGYLTGDDRFAAPALHVNTWHDIAIRGTFESAALMRRNAVTETARLHQHVLIGPGLHCSFDAPFVDGIVGDLPVALDAGLDLQTLYDAWLDHWLRDGPMPELAQYTFFVLGANRWETSEEWPPRDARPLRLYLGAADSGIGTLSLDAPDGGAKSYLYDPADPTPSIGGPICCTGGLDLRAGPLDQSPNRARDDVLTFVTDPLDDAITLAGDITAEIAFSSDAPDTDLIAVLIDLAPDGTQVAIQSGALRMRYRNGFDRPELLEPGKPTRASLSFAPIAYEIARGHRIGLHLSSASFPRLERNLNTGGPNYLAKIPRKARNTVHFAGEAGASSLLLPVLPTRP